MPVCCIPMFVNQWDRRSRRLQRLNPTELKVCQKPVHNLPVRCFFSSHAGSDSCHFRINCRFGDKCFQIKHEVQFRLLYVLFGQFLVFGNSSHYVVNLNVVGFLAICVVFAEVDNRQVVSPHYHIVLFGIYRILFGL